MPLHVDHMSPVLLLESLSQHFYISFLFHDSLRV